MSSKPEKTKSFDLSGFFVWPCVAFVVRFGLAVRLSVCSAVCMFGCSVCLFVRPSVPVSAVRLFRLSVPVRSGFGCFGCSGIRPAVRGSGRAEPGGLYVFLFRSSRLKGESLLTYWINRPGTTASRYPGRAGKSLFTYRAGRPVAKTPLCGVADLLIWVRG